MIESLYQDIPRFYTAIAEWCACMVYLNVLKKRVSGPKGWGIAGAALALQCALLVLTGMLPTIFWIPSMLTAAGLMFLFLRINSREQAVTVGYYCAKAFLLAEFAASLEWQLHCFWVIYRGYQSPGIKIAMLLAVYAVVFGAAWWLERSLVKEDALLSISGRELWSSVIIVAAAFAFSNLSFIYTDSPFSSRFIADIFNIRTMVDLGGLAILSAFQSRISELNVEHELSSIHSVLKSQYDHYLHYQESIDVINLKYHDLKHQIAGLRAETDSGRRTEWLDAMEQELDIYEALNKTGNKVLDTVLMGKILHCKKHNIKITCVADGMLLNFMHVTDICSIFGNALDNAIESVIVEPDPEKRLIHVSVSSQRDFVFIQVENYCEQEIRLENHFPVTTKADKKSHGFGLKSIRYAAEKYEGTLSFGINKNWFELKILIPKKEVSVHIE